MNEGLPGPWEVQSLGGQLQIENRSEGGLRAIIRLPRLGVA